MYRRFENSKAMVLASKEAKPPWLDTDCSAIFEVYLYIKYRTSCPLGFCVDIGAPRSVIGNSELKILIV